MQVTRYLNNIIQMIKSGLLIKHYYQRVYILISKKRPIKNNKIVCDHFVGKGYGGDARYLAEELIKRDSSLDIVWLYDDAKCSKKDFPEFIRPININTNEAIKELTDSRVWITNYRSEIFNTCKKRKGQIYIQCWHGGVCIKAVEKDAEETLPKEYVELAKHDSKMADFFLSCCEWRTTNYRNAFWYDGTILKKGLPSMDVFSQNVEQTNNYVRKCLGISSSTKIALYAPTFRNSSDKNPYYIDTEKLLKALEDRFGGDWCIIIRMHPNVATLQDNIVNSDKVINGTNYPDMNDILVASDILITDYSGCIFDAFYANKKVFLFATDLEEYLKKERKLYFNIEQLPAPLAKNNMDLMNAIKLFDEETYEKNRNSFIEQLGYYNVNNSTALVVDHIMEILRSS